MIAAPCKWRLRLQSLITALTSIAVVGCAELTTQQIQVPLASRATLSGANAELLNCGMSVTFDGNARPLSQADQDVLRQNPILEKFYKWQIDGFGYEMYRHYQMVVCVCRDMTFTTTEVANFEKQARTGSGNRFIRSISGRHLRTGYEADVPGEGSLRARVLVWFPLISQNCFAWSAVQYVGDFPADGERFLASVREVPSAQAGSSAGQAPLSSKPPVSARLAELKDLFDRGLITKDEYDKKRKAILDEL